MTASEVGAGSGCRSAPRGRRAEHMGSQGFFRSDPTVDSRAPRFAASIPPGWAIQGGVSGRRRRGLARSLDGGTGRVAVVGRASGERRGGDDWVCSGAGRDGPFGGPGEIGAGKRRLGTGGLVQGLVAAEWTGDAEAAGVLGEGRGAHACRKRPLGRPRRRVSISDCEGGARRLASAGPGTSLVDRG